MGKKLFDIKFDGIEELEKLAKTQAELLSKNVETAIARTTHLGISRIANDCPVDTGLLRASIAGEYADAAGVELKHGKKTEGKALSATKIDLRNLEGRIGTNVEYALYVEYKGEGGYKKVKRKLSNKQRRYLFYKGILKRDDNGKVIYNYKKKKKQGKGFFRKNIPVIRAQFKWEMNKAIEATKEGRLLRAGKGD